MELGKYAKNVWETQLGQKIIYVHATADWSEYYEVDANLTVVDSLQEAMNLYNNIVNQKEDV